MAGRGEVERGGPWDSRGGMRGPAWDGAVPFEVGVSEAIEEGLGFAPSGDAAAGGERGEGGGGDPWACGPPAPEEEDGGGGELHGVGAEGVGA